MSAKTERLKQVYEVITNNELGSQEEVIQVLRQKGIKLTQATLSRDFKELNVVKERRPQGGYYYKIATLLSGLPESSNIPLSSISSMEFSSSFVVLKTHPGFAGAIAAVIDRNAISQIAGTIAGDDTILVIIKEGSSREEALKAITQLIKANN